MPLNITKIAYGSESPATLRAWLERGSKAKGGPGYALMTTRYMPKRVAEMDGGSLYWIHSHTIIGRSPILRFEENVQGRYSKLLEPVLIPVRSTPKRAHQGWRYLKEEDAPRDLAEGEDVGDVLPGKMAAKLERLGLI